MFIQRILILGELVKYMFICVFERNAIFSSRIICGLTAFTTKQHIIRASLEAVCFQTRDILEAMNMDCGFPLTKLNTDGKMSTNNLLMQLQADLCGTPVCKCIGCRRITGCITGFMSEMTHLYT